MKMAEFKRSIKPGDFVTMLENTINPRNPYIGVRRKVSAINSVDLMIETEKDGTTVNMYSPLPKAADFACDGDTFTFTRHYTSRLENDRVTWKWERMARGAHGKQYTISSTHGKLTVNADGHVIECRAGNEEPDGGGHLKSITRFDLAEWRRHWRKPMPLTLDILDLGYWYTDLDTKHAAFAPPDEKWRSEIAESLLGRRAGAGAS
jgi:hypothetical protein